MNYNLKASDNFKKFMFDLQEWIDAGLPNTPQFRKEDSLCFQVDNWGRNKGISDREVDLLYAYLQRWLPKAKEDEEMPFNKDDAEYAAEMGDETFGHYANPVRLKWIRDVAEHLKSQEV